MSLLRIAAVVAATFAERAPPTEIQLWNAGANPTDYGVHVWNERSIAEVLARYNDRGNPLLVDVEHNGAKLEDGEPAATAGYARLEVRSGAPWLVFEWSAFGTQQIESGQRRFLSPEYDVDKNTGEILALYRVSLVADPGTHRARMLATANREDTMDLQVILAALRAALAAEDPAVAKESITNLLAELQKSAGDGGGGAAPADSAPTDADAKPADDKPAPMAAAGDDAPGDKPKDDDTTKASAKPEPKKAAAPAPKAAPPTVDKAVTDAAGAAVVQIKAAQRDHLIATQGDRLEPSIRRWAATQPLEIVEGLLAATPAKADAKQRTAATRGATQGGDPEPQGLQPKELAELRQLMGTTRIETSRGPHVNADRTALVLPTETPTQARARINAAAAVVAGGKDGK